MNAGLAVKGETIVPAKRLLVFAFILCKDC